MVTHTAMNPDQRFRQEDLITIEIEALKKIFEDRPLKSIITLSCKCSDCGNDLFLTVAFYLSMPLTSTLLTVVIATT